MEKCPQCGEMTAQANLYTGQIVCYHRWCGYEEKLDNGELNYTLYEALDKKLDKELAISIMKELLEKIEAEKKGEK
jgi:hypothetical protein